MNRYPLWKYILVLTVLLLGLLYSLPNIFGESPAVQITTAKTSNKLDPALLGKVEETLKQESIKIDAIFMDATGVKVRFSDADTQIKAKDVLKNNLGKDYVVALNLISRSPSWLTNLHARP
jgi:preprotein translocase subunit SecD